MDHFQGIIKQTFTPNRVTSFKDIVRGELTMESDVFEKYQATASVKGELTICKDINKLIQQSKKLVYETYNEYLDVIKKRQYKQDKWIYDIIDGKSEQQRVLYRDKLCLIVPPSNWTWKRIDRLNLMCISTDKELRSIRDLTSKHIPLLQHMKNKTIEVITEKYGLKEEDLKMFFHYEPSTYHLHIHFIYVGYYYAPSSVEYCHELNSVMFNLLLDNDYYKKINLIKRAYR